MSHPEILTGPYGTRLTEIGQQTGDPTLNRPVSILNGNHAREAVEQVATEYLHAGANVAAINAFGLRSLIHQPGEIKTYRHAVHGQQHALRKAITKVGKKVREVISFGPTNDCYLPDNRFTAREAQDFHEVQAHEAKVINVDTAWFETVNTSAEAVGIARAAKKYKVPCVISFVLNANGDLLSGESVADAVRAVDSASGSYPLGYSLNCCPIEALEKALKRCGDFSQRIIAAYPNASSKDQRELERSTEVVGLVDYHGASEHLHYLAKRYRLKMIGGCCGYNNRDIGLIHAKVHAGIYGAGLPKTDLESL